MIRKLLFILSLVACTHICAQNFHTFNVPSAGSLKGLVEGKQYQIVNLKLTGTIDARDFVVMRDYLPLLAIIDLSEVTIAEYKGKEGTWNDFRGDWMIPNDYNYCEYAKNAIPRDAFVQMKDNSIRKYYAGKQTLRRVILPTELTDIEEKAFYLCKEIEYYEISSLATNFLTEDGIVYSKDKKTLVLYPVAKTGSYQVIPTIEVIKKDAFKDCTFSLLKFKSNTPPAFLNTPTFSAALVQVPEGCIDNYSTILDSHKLVDQWVEATILVNEAGTLSNAIINTGHHPTTINKLIVSGTLNDSDFSALASMKLLYSLDLSAITNTSIPNDVFGYKQTLCEIILPENLEIIGNGAFNNCENLIGEIIIPESVYEIGYNAFQNTKIEKIKLSADLRTIGTQAFKDSYLKSVDISACIKITDIANSVFENCTKLSSVALPPSLKTIGEKAFFMTNLNDIVFPASTTNIGKNAFYQCPLKQIKLPASLISIDDGAFSKNIQLSIVEFSGCTQLQSLGGGAFSCNSNLENVNLSPCISLRTIGNGAFSGYIHQNGAVIHPAPALVPSGLKKITLPLSLEKLNPSAFYDCMELQQINLENCTLLESIGSQAFAYCEKLEHIILPVSLAEIGSYAYMECTGITSITSKSPTPPVAVNAFGELDVSKITLNIPNETKSKYMFAPTWEDFVLVNEIGYAIKALIKFTNPLGQGIVPGAVSGSDLYEENAAVTLTATPFKHYKFIEWVDEEGVLLSTQATYSFKATKNQLIYAVFDIDESNPIVPNIVMQTTKKAGEEVMMSIVTTSKNKEITIDWGNGVFRTYTLGDHQQFHKNKQVALVKTITPTDLATIKIYGDNINRLYVSSGTSYGNMRLSSLELNNCPNLTLLDCENNSLTKLDLSNCPNITTLLCAVNHLGFSSFSQKFIETCDNNSFIQVYSIPTEINTNEPLDLSSELYIPNGVSPTRYTWYSVHDDTELTPGIDYKENNGIFTFLGSCYIYCIMTNPDIPKVEIYANYMKVYKEEVPKIHVLSINSPTATYANTETTIECELQNKGDGNLTTEFHIAAVPEANDNKDTNIEMYRIDSKEWTIQRNYTARFTTTLPNGLPNAGRHRMYVYTLDGGVKILPESSPQYITIDEKPSYDKEDVDYDFSLSRIILRQSASNQHTTNRNSSSCFLTHLDIINHAFNGSISYGLLQNDDLIEIIGTGTPTNLYGFDGTGLDIWCTIPNSIPSGEYELVLLSKREEDKKYKLVDDKIGIYNIQVQLTDTEVTYLFPNRETPEISVLSITTLTTAYANTETIIECELQNRSVGDLATVFHIAAVPEANDNKDTNLEMYTIASRTRVIYEESTVKFATTLPNGFPNVGRYRMYVYTLDNEMQVLPESSPQYITVKDETSSPPILTLSSAFTIYEEEYPKKPNEYIEFNLKLESTHSDLFTIGFFACDREDHSIHHLLFEKKIQVNAGYVNDFTDLGDYTNAFVDMELGDYFMYISYLVDEEWERIEPHSLNSANFRLIPTTAPKPFISAPLIINEGQEIPQGGNGKIKATIKCTDNYTGGIFVDTEGVLVGADTNVSLQANIEQTIELVYSVYNNAPLGEHTLCIKFTDREGIYSPVIIDGFEDSARFTVVVPTGIDNAQQENRITAFVTPEGFLVKGIKEGYQIQILNIKAKVVCQKIADGSEVLIPMTHNSKGIYLITIADKQNITTIKAIWQ